MSFEEHHRCLRSLGLEKDFFAPMEGEWTDHFTAESALSDSSSGEFGDVVIVRRNSDNKRLAMKLFQKELSADEHERIGIALHLSQVSGEQWPPTLVRYLEALQFSEGEQRQALLMEPLDGITFKQAVAERLQMAPEQSMCFLRDVLSGLAFLHANGIAHRDVHPGNIMITEDGKRAVLLDLDLLCKADESNKDCARLCSGVATPDSTPPDVWCSADHRTGLSKERWFRADVWGAASAYVSLLTNSRPFAHFLPYSTTRSPETCIGASDQKMQAAFDSAIAKLKQYNVPGLAIVTTMLSLDWKLRPSAAKALLLLPKCADRSAFTLPLTDAQFLAKVQSGEIVPTGEYVDADF